MTRAKGGTMVEIALSPNASSTPSRAVQPSGGGGLQCLAERAG